MKKMLLNLEEIYSKVYPDNSKVHFDLLKKIITERHEERPISLKQLDKRPHDWYQSEKMMGMMLYVNLFSDSLLGLIDKIPYLKDLGITYIHLMPLLKPRVGENDGGYAVEDYLDIDPSLGTLNDFIVVLDEFRKSDIDICIDYVLNHTADTHEWAKLAKKGSKEHQDMYFMYDDRLIPDLYDETVPEVLPDKSPGNFTYNESLKKWIFTSFSEFQWDLNFQNPRVFNEMVDILLHLANYGVNILRLDAIAFMWKEIGSDCRNHVNVHVLLSMFHMIKEVVCPSLVLLGEAIVQPDEIVKYFGEAQQECGLLYNANLMVNIFNSFATRDTRLMSIDAMRFKIPKHGCFMNYVRCHDDIGWGLSNDSLKTLNINAHDHKNFLNEFYSGSFKGSFSSGEIYQFNPVTMDARINGTLASLLGLEKAIDKNDLPGIDVAIKRILLAHAMILTQRGIPLIYSGDEIATLNDHSYLEEDHKNIDSRWLHRKKFEWSVMDDLDNYMLPSSKVYHELKNMIHIKTTEKLFNAHIHSKVLEVHNHHVFVVERSSKDDHVLLAYNFSEDNQYVSEGCFSNCAFTGLYKDLLTSKIVDMNEEFHLHPYEYVWLKPIK